MKKILETRLFIGDTPIEDIPQEDRERFAREASEKLAKVLSELLGGRHEQSRMQRL